MINLGSASKFVGKFCATKMDFEAIKSAVDNTDAKACTSKGNFFAVDSSNGNCQYSFNGAVVSQIAKTGAVKHKGFTLTYTS